MRQIHQQSNSMTIYFDSNRDGSDMIPTLRSVINDAPDQPELVLNDKLFVEIILDKSGCWNHGFPAPDSKD